MSRRFVVVFSTAFATLFVVLVVLVGYSVRTSSESTAVRNVTEVLQRSSDRDACITDLSSFSDDQIRQVIVAAIHGDDVTLDRIAAEIEAAGPLIEQIERECPSVKVKT